MLRTKICIGVSLAALVYVLGCSPQGNHAEPFDPETEARVQAMRDAYQEGDLRTVLVLADSIDRYAPGLVDVAYTRGLALNALRRYPEARLALLHVVEQNPEYRGAWYHLGHNAFLQQKYREAIRFYKKEQLLVAEIVEEKKDERIDAEELSTIVAQIGRAYDKMGVPDSARLAYDEALSLDSTLAVTHAWLSEWYENQGQLEQAFHHARKALHSDPQNLEYIYRLGYLYLQNGYPAESVPFLGLVAQQWPGHEGASYNLGRALKAIGKEKEGEALLDRVEEIQHLQEEALVAERGVETYPDDPQRWIKLADLMLQSGYLDKAEQAFQAARALRPDDLNIQNDLANLALARGDTATAVHRFQNLLRTDSTFAAGWLNLGIIYAMTGRREAARQAWQKTLRYDPDDPQAQAYLAGLD